MTFRKNLAFQRTSEHLPTAARDPPSNDAIVPFDSSSTTRGIPAKLIKPWSMGPQNKYIFTNANVVDTKKGIIVPHATVTISDGFIDSIESSSKSLAVEATSNATVVDLEGKYLCPGLFDCHVHIMATAGDTGAVSSGLSKDAKISLFRQPYLCGQILSRGFTTVRDTGGASLALKEAIEDDVFPGPRLFISNKALSQTGGHGDSRKAHENNCCPSGDADFAEIADGVPAALLATRTQIRVGADFIKIMVGGGVASPTDKLESTQFTAEEIQAISTAAASAGTYVTAHAYTPKAIRHAIDNGVKGIEHGNMIDEDTAKVMAERGIWLTPTLVTYDAMGSDKYAGFLPPANAKKNRAVLSAGVESLRIAAAAGVKICHGSDLLGPLHAEQNREFSIRAKALSGKQILQSATVIPAEMLGQKDVLGQVKEGFVADLLVLRKNPLEDVSSLDDPENNILSVVKNGRVYSSRWKGLPTDVQQVARL